MNAQVRYGVAALCVAALAGLIALIGGIDGSAAGNGIYSLGVLIALPATVVGLVLVLVGVLRAR